MPRGCSQVSNYYLQRQTHTAAIVLGTPKPIPTPSAILSDSERPPPLPVEVGFAGSASEVCVDLPGTKSGVPQDSLTGTVITGLVSAWANIATSVVTGAGTHQSTLPAMSEYVRVTQYGLTTLLIPFCYSCFRLQELINSPAASANTKLVGIRT